MNLSGKSAPGTGKTTAGWEQKISRRLAEIPPSGIRVFFDLVAGRDDIISLGVGEPDFDTPRTVANAAIEAIRSGSTYYTGNQGLPSLRKKIAEYLENRYRISYDPNEEILITVGVSEAVDLAFRSILNPGDGVLYGTPSYVSYNPLIKMCDGVPQPIETTFENNFLFDPKNLEKSMTQQSKALFLNYPSNPTGASFRAGQLEEIRQFVLEKDLLVISDEIYGELCYDFEHIPFATLDSMKERTLFLGGFSKTFAMTGWRIGYAAGPAPWIKAMLKIHQYAMLCAPTPSQYAAEAALSYAGADAERMKETYMKRRELIVTEFNRIGLETNMPNGAFYVFPRIKNSGLSSMEFATRLLQEQNIAVVPGSAFGATGEGFIRCSYATSFENIRKSVAGIEAFLASL